MADGTKGATPKADVRRASFALGVVGCSSLVLAPLAMPGYATQPPLSYVVSRQHGNHLQYTRGCQHTQISPDVYNSQRVCQQGPVDAEKRDQFGERESAPSVARVPPREGGRGR